MPHHQTIGVCSVFLFPVLEKCSCLFLWWRRKWQPTPVFLPGESRGRRSLVGYSPQVAKSQTQLSDFTFTFAFFLWYIFKYIVLVSQSYLTFCDSMDCNLLGSSVNGILQARILEWVAIPFSRGSFQTRGQTLVFCIAGRFFILP